VGRFLDRELAQELRAEHGPADVVLANNVMAHVPDLTGFVGGLVDLLAEDGVLQVENPGVRYLIEHVEFDTVYHEHYCYFSTHAVEHLMRRHGLVLNDVELLPRPAGRHAALDLLALGGQRAPAEQQLREERELGLDGLEPYLSFGARVAEVQHGLRELLGELQRDGRTVAAYGAAAKGATLLNTTGIGDDLVAFTVDRNPHKQGRLDPGARVPVLAPEALLEQQPDYVLLLAWNYAEEIRLQQQEYERRGGRFILPVPTPRVL
jgi:hypothetical protein